MTELEARRRFSESLIWTYMSKQYEWLGSEIWRVVPHEVTTNPVICRAFARLSAAWQRDLQNEGGVNPDSPLTVFEIGAGSGRFAHGFLRHYPGRVRYLVTDRVGASLRAVAEHPALRAAVSDGRIEVFPFDAAAPKAPELPKDAPCVVIANYVFNSLPHDLFRVEQGRLDEVLVSLEARGELPDEKSFVAAFEQLAMRFDAEPVARPRYDEPAIERLLDLSLARGDATLLMPVAPLRALEVLRRASGGRMLVLSADKAWCDANDDMGPNFSLKGPLSAMTNFSAIADWARVDGGDALLSRAAMLSYLVARRDGLASAPELAREFSESILELSPEDRRIVSASEAPSGAGLRWYWAALRAGGCDPRQVVRFAPGIAALKHQASNRDDKELRAILKEAAANHFVMLATEPFPSIATRLLLDFGLRNDLSAVLGELAATYGLDLGRLADEAALLGAAEDLQAQLARRLSGA